MPKASNQELSRACEVLFGRRVSLPRLTGSVWQNALRTAFRKRALETHPDRAAILNRSEADLAREFEAICRAYQLLEALPRSPTVPAADRQSAPEQSEPPGASAVRADRPDHLFEGPIPPRPLRFAEYLYYSRRISFWTLAEALSWQRRQRPAIGRIAIERGHLTQSQVAQILAARHREKAHQEPFGQYAVRRGFLNPEQLLTLLGRQKLLQQRIGQFFIDRAILSPDQIQAARSEMQRHNSQRRGQWTAGA